MTKWSVTVREPAQVPRAFQQAFHLMRSGRPGPVLIDLPFDVQMAEIEFDIDTYEPLPVYKPTATRKQVEKAIEMLQAAERPLIVAGGGIINADACDLLVEFAELTGVPVIPTLMGWGTIPDDHPLMAGMCGLQTCHRYGNATMLASDFVLGIGNRWANRHTGSTEVYCKGRKFVHVDIEPTQIGRVFAPDLGIVSDAKAALELFVEVAREMEGGRHAARLQRLGRRCRERKRTMQRKTNFDNVPMKPQRVYQEHEQRLRPRHDLRQHHRPVADRRRAVPARLQAAPLDQLRPGRPARLDHPGRARRARRRPDAQDRRRCRATTTSSS